MSKVKLDKEQPPFAMERLNYIILLVGVGVIALGFIIMAMDSEQHGFGFFGLTLGPIVVMIGFITQFFAILYKPKKSA